MSSAGFTVDGGRGGSERIVLATAGDRDRELLVEWLDETTGYEVVAATAPGELPDAYDLCILDEESLSAFRPALEARHRDVDPVYLPCLLLTTDEEGARRTDGIDGDDATAPLIDDIVSIPVDKRALRRRVENLLRARRASVRLAEQEDQYRRLVELTPEAILLVDDGRIVYGNEAAVRLFGVDSAAALEGRALADFAVEADRETLHELSATATGEDRPSEFAELALRSEDGETVLTEAASVTVTYRGKPTTQFVVRDLTEQKQRERRLGVFERAIESTVQGITVADAEQDDEPIVYANPAFERITGYGLDETLGRNCRFLQGEGTDPETVARVREAIDEQRPVTVELLNYRKDGTTFWNRLDIVPVADNEGTVTHFLGLQRDVTERKEREQRLAVLDRILRHNLSNKMSVIRGYAELIEDGEAPDPVDAAGRIVAAADELLGLSEQVRAFRGVIAAEQRDLERIDLVEVIESAAVELHDFRAGGSFDLDAPESAEVWAHRTLPAAIRHLFVLASGSHAPRLDVRIDESDGRTLLEVIDRDGTLREEDLRTASGHRETPLEHPQGLELWLVRWAVEYSGGNFCVDFEGDAPAIRLRFNRPPEE